MFESFEEYKDRGMLMVVLLSVISIAVSGIWFGVTYFVLDSIQTSLQSVDCVIQNNTLVDSCQGLFNLSFYPFLALKDVLVWVNFFFIFSLVLGMLVLGYRSGKSPVLMGYLLIVVIVMTYLGIHIANIYNLLLANDVFRTMMVKFTVYNRIMASFPWFIFIVSLMAALLGIVNYQRSAVNKDDNLNY